MNELTGQTYDVYYEITIRLRKNVGLSLLSKETKTRLFTLFKKLDDLADYFAENNERGGLLCLCTYVASLLHNMESEVQGEYRHIMSRILQKKELLLADELKEEAAENSNFIH